MSSEEMRVRFVSALLAWHGVSPAELGQRLGNTRGTIYKKLQGERAFTTRDLEMIADVFDVDPGLLLRPQTAAAVLGSVREPAPDLLPCTLRQAPQVRGYASRRPVGKDSLTPCGLGTAA